MSIADRFPEYDLTLPDWLTDASDDETSDTPAELARRAAAEDLAALRQKIDGMDRAEGEAWCEHYAPNGECGQAECQPADRAEGDGSADT